MGWKVILRCCLGASHNHCNAPRPGHRSQSSGHVGMWTGFSQSPTEAGPTPPCSRRYHCDNPCIVIFRNACPTKSKSPRSYSRPLLSLSAEWAFQPPLPVYPPSAPAHAATVIPTGTLRSSALARSSTLSTCLTPSRWSAPVSSVGRSPKLHFAPTSGMGSRLMTRRISRPMMGAYLNAWPGYVSGGSAT